MYWQRLGPIEDGIDENETSLNLQGVFGVTDGKLIFVEQMRLGPGGLFLLVSENKNDFRQR